MVRLARNGFRETTPALALALRLGANSLHHADSYLGEFFRRISRKLDKPSAITATAHKLASREHEAEQEDLH
jgi:hypothetical protein